MECRVNLEIRARQKWQILSWLLQIVEVSQLICLRFPWPHPSLWTPQALRVPQLQWLLTRNLHPFHNLIKLLLQLRLNKRIAHLVQIELLILLLHLVNNLPMFLKSNHLVLLMQLEQAVLQRILDRPLIVHPRVALLVLLLLRRKLLLKAPIELLLPIQLKVLRLQPPTATLRLNKLQVQLNPQLELVPLRSQN